MEFKKGKIILYAGPSGSGKGTVKEIFLKNKDLNISFSISATTRTPRKNEKDGVEYFFLTTEKFEQMIKENKFLEWAKFSNNYYGTPLDFIYEKINKGINVLLEIEIVGIKNVLKIFPDAITIFLTPPSLKDLRERLIKRKTDSLEEIENRIKIAKEELKFKNLFKYQIVNDDIHKAAHQVLEILREELN